MLKHEIRSAIKAKALELEKQFENKKHLIKYIADQGNIIKNKKEIVRVSKKLGICLQNNEHMANQFVVTATGGNNFKIVSGLYIDKPTHVQKQKGAYFDATGIRISIHAIERHMTRTKLYDVDKAIYELGSAFCYLDQHITALMMDKALQPDGSIDKWIKTPNGFAAVHLDNAHENRYTCMTGVITTFVSTAEAKEWNEEDFNKELETQKYDINNDPNYKKKEGKAAVVLEDIEGNLYLEPNPVSILYIKKTDKI